MLNFIKMIKHTLFLATLIIIGCNNTESTKDNDLKKIIEKSDKEELFLEKELNVYRDLTKGIEKAKTENKPIFLYFTGHALPLKNKVKSNILLKNTTTFKLLKNNYINVWLYVDDKNTGKKWFDYQKNNFKYMAQPFFSILDTDGVILSEGLDYGDAYRSLEEVLKKHIYKE